MLSERSPLRVGGGHFAGAKGASVQHPKADIKRLPAAHYLSPERMAGGADKRPGGRLLLERLQHLVQERLVIPGVTTPRQAETDDDMILRRTHQPQMHAIPAAIMTGDVPAYRLFLNCPFL